LKKPTEVRPNNAISENREQLISLRRPRSRIIIDTQNHDSYTNKELTMLSPIGYGSSGSGGISKAKEITDEKIVS
tara:strand:+ start:615 stop:839 length:225 start_codon:yes stop_codon:yes gene_type:complete